MASNINDPVRSEDTSVNTVVAAEEQALLEQLEAQAPKKRDRSTTMQLIFMLF